MSIYYKCKNQPISILQECLVLIFFAQKACKIHNLNNAKFSKINLTFLLLQSKYSKIKFIEAQLLSNYVDVTDSLRPSVRLFVHRFNVDETL